MAITPQVNALYARKVVEVNSDLSTKYKTIAVLLTKSPCPNCRQDPATGDGTGVFNGTGSQSFTDGQCPVCSNRGFVQAEERRRLIANTRIGTGDSVQAAIRSQGYLPKGYARIKVPVRFHSVLLAADHFLIQGQTHRGTYRREGEVLTRGLKTEVMAECTVKLDK